MKTRDPLDPLEPHEVPREPRTPRLWIILTLVALAVLLWILLSLANQPEEGTVREGAARPPARPLDFPSSRNQHREVAMGRLPAASFHPPAGL